MVIKYLVMWWLPAFIALRLILSCTQYQASASADTAEDTETNDGAPSVKKIHEEEDEIGYIQSLIVNTPALATVTSTYQEIEVYDSPHFGKVFVLDDCLQLTERDASHYNEMLAHVPVMEYIARRETEEPMKVLVIGGGDGYVVSELLKYPQVQSIDHIELDGDVIDVAKEHLPWGHAWEDPRVNLVIGDGAAFVRQQAEDGKSYHVIVQDASDPFYMGKDGEMVTLPSSVLYDKPHFESLQKMLQPTGGALMFQAETYNIPTNLESIRKWRNMLDELGFDAPRYGSISISTYPMGQIGFFAAHARKNGDTIDISDGERVCKSIWACMDALPEMDWNRILAQFDELEGKTRYYHPRMHRSAFDLPLWVEEYLYGDGVGYGK